ncbi:hypothetical protein C8Q75DRAFT_373799 [Abortiporus biennis]|nr:hypothetical protein C8Q75DRAFT_373799 [Abortiporus biennis]
MHFMLNNAALFLLGLSSLVSSQHIYGRDVYLDSLEARHDTYGGFDFRDRYANHIPSRLHARNEFGSPQYFEARDASFISELELRDLISRLVRRGGPRSHAKANARPSTHRKPHVEPPKEHEHVHHSGNEHKVPVSWKKGAVEEMKLPLSQKWGKNQDPVQKHEEIVRNHAHKISGAHSAVIHHAAHPGGSKPTEKDHITAGILNHNGSPIKNPEGYPRHHVYTDRENHINLKPFLTPGLKDTKFETKGKHHKYK